VVSFASGDCAAGRGSRSLGESQKLKSFLRTFELL
jgi:hypothetical protein